MDTSLSPNFGLEFSNFEDACTF